MALTIREAKRRSEVQDFLSVAHRLHADDPIWTPPLRADLERSLGDANPLWQGSAERALLVAYEGREPVGRVLAHVHHASNQRHGERAGFFGLLECMTPEVGHALLAAAADRHRAQGLAVLRGPYELTITQCIGAVTQGFDEPAAFSQSWNGPQLPPALEAFGMKPVYTAATHRLDDVSATDPDALLGDKQRAWLRNPGVRVRPFDLERFDHDMRAATELLNASFAANFGFVALSPEELAFLAGPMKRVLRPEITVFIELDGEAVGVGVALPDFHVLFRRMGGELWPLGWAHFLAGARTLDAAVVQFLATQPRLQNQGLMRIVVAEMIRGLQRAGFRTLDGTWIGDVNAKSQAQAKAVGMREKHRLTLYEKSLSSD